MMNLRDRDAFERRYALNSGQNEESRPKLNFESGIFVIFMIAFSISMFYTVAHFNDSLPKPLLEEVEGRFIAKRAYKHLSDIANIGPKVIGSEQNDQIAFKMVLDKVNWIKNNSRTTNDIEIDTQIVSGSFPLMFRGLEFTNVYHNVQNILVKIGKSPQSLLVNCHFDSVPTSPGASDDVLNCAVMLEVFQVLSQSKAKLPFSVIFLFNGAEEGVLLASHGFITQHKWAKQIKSFINLESCGAGGREILFQAGPNHPWLITKYASVPHPHGMVVAEEVFQSGLVASDTDFRIFRDFGQLSGLDFAHYGNGYVYHTRFDNIKSIPNVEGVLQHTGDNLLSLILSIVNSNELIAPSASEGKTVYFDFLGLFFIHLSDKTYMYINYVTIILSTLSILLMSKRGGNHRQVLIYGVLSTIAGLLLSFAHNLMLAFFLDYKNFTLTWFSTPGFIIPLYFIPSIVICFFTATIRCDTNLTRWEKVKSQCLSTQMTWTLLLLALTIQKIRSAYIIQIIVMFPTLASLMLGERVRNQLIWTLAYISSTFPTSFYTTYLTVNVFKLFIPMSGRINDHKNPEILIAILSTFLAFAIVSYIIPLILAITTKDMYLFILSVLTWGPLVFIFGSSVIFPFTEKMPQRIFVSHVNREIYSLNGELEMSDSFFWTFTLDRRGRNVLPMFSEENDIVKFCEKFEFCGVPWPTHATFMASNRSFYAMTKPHSYTDQTHLALSDNKVYRSASSKPIKRRLSFNATGPDHMVLFISLRPNVYLNGWSFGAVPSPSYTNKNMTIYFLSYYHGLVNSVWNFWLDLKVMPADEPSVDIGLSGFHLHHDQEFTKEFKNYMVKFPNFTHLTPSMTVFKHYVF